ncbi:MAG: hypothetical protein LIO58_05285 [Oscillospiraceae bacterium]|nr:hypothetical protein [Oscillospiraceae bacterium]
MLHMVREGMGVGLIANSTYEYLKSCGICKITIAEDYRFQFMAGFLDLSDSRSQRMAAYFERCIPLCQTTGAGAVPMSGPDFSRDNTAAALLEWRKASAGNILER